MLVIDPQKLSAFALVSGAVSVVPGPSMMYVAAQAIRYGGRTGAAALAGLQLGYALWWVLAAVGLGALATQLPLAFNALAIGGALYLAWIGVRAWRYAGQPQDSSAPLRAHSRDALRDGILVAIGNPKALIYIIAVVPPFVDSRSPVVPQLVLLAIVAIVIDVIVGALYILAGNRLAKAITRPRTRSLVDRIVGGLLTGIALALLANLLIGTAG